ncbi:MAG TPA: HAMP domain-containing histidine kinase [Candidatus Fimiplasma intestinipullorum]|uniref:Heme sensor protein HssS n=1 Tax=Candidatus Fimiplasma intestinipullorum TaxID=2840825 RepID=A0A9D1HL74_9FIRM|nr:HAMP domain-containing histidine kinase [Candidatus Fimiplasma intestinipullorum]
MKSLYGKLIAGFFISIAISFSFAGYLGLQSHSQSFRALTEDDLLGMAETVESLLISHHEDFLDELANVSGMTIILVDDQGRVTLNGTQPLASLPEEIQNARIDDEGFFDSNTHQHFFREKIQVDGHTYTLFISRDTMQEQTVFERSIMVALASIFISGSIIFLIIADVIVKPIKRLTKATDELSKGNYEARVHYYGKDEIASLSNSFNSMADRLVRDEETRQQFISDISHEFQTPLTSIQGFAKILKQENLSEEQRTKYTDIILFQSQRLSALSKNMLQLTVLDSEDPKLEIKKYPLLEQLNRVISMQNNEAASKDIEIVTDFPKKDILINADENRMEQVWINLINNAIKYTSEGGVVTIKVKKNLKEVSVAIEDTGIGMSKEALQHIFDRFYREDKSRSIAGNGLGLSIVKRIVELHQARISVVSQVDVGSVFTVTMPLEFLKQNAKKNTINDKNQAA